MYYINNFLLYSILGYIFEITISLIFSTKIQSGFLYGPYTLVYGFSLTLLFLLYKKFKQIKPNYKKIITMFLSSFIILLIIELLGGVLLKNIYKIEMWNYKDLPLNIGKYISIEITTMWSFMTILIYYYIKPHTDKFIKKIPSFITVFLLVIVCLDFIIKTINTIY